MLNAANAFQSNGCVPSSHNYGYIWSRVAESEVKLLNHHFHIFGLWLLNTMWMKFGCQHWQSSNLKLF